MAERGDPVGLAFREPNFLHNVCVLEIWLTRLVGDQSGGKTMLDRCTDRFDSRVTLMDARCIRTVVRHTSLHIAAPCAIRGADARETNFTRENRNQFETHSDTHTYNPIFHTHIHTQSTSTLAKLGLFFGPVFWSDLFYSRLMFSPGRFCHGFGREPILRLSMRTHLDQPSGSFRLGHKPLFASGPISNLNQQPSDKRAKTESLF